ncbi:hypothetical protein JEQ12_010991 [Ovis aries]|uniref:G-protein coupled receptors family 1 profile domain-containing protein n=1 Tax=Ovis aries TaxID=9940 RepID=A0A835ZLT9_SHEEP|nr:hypothetical protein JEQ12_010991 [Ovis aries]
MAALVGREPCFFFSTDGLEVVRNILIVVLSFSFMHNLLLGFEFTYMIPQTKYTLMTCLPLFPHRYTAAKLEPPLKWHWPLDKYKQSINGSASLITIPKSARESQVMEQHGVSKLSRYQQVCLMLTVGVYAMGLVGAMANTGCMLRLSFCDGNIINHYMCDIPPLLQLSCTSTSINELEIFIVVGVNVIVPSITISISYTLILLNILRIRSAEGRSKAFSTCSSHIIVVSLFFGSSAFMYLKPFPARSLDEDKVSTIFYTIVGPMVNPFIYSLRNKDVQVALRKTLKKRVF